MSSVISDPLIGVEDRNEYCSPEFRGLLTAWMLFEVRKHERMDGGRSITMQYIPATKRLIVKSPKDEWIVEPELLLDLRSELGSAARAAMRAPGVEIFIGAEEKQ